MDGGMPTIKTTINLTILLIEVLQNLLKCFIWDGNVQAILAVSILLGFDQFMIFKFCQMRVQGELTTHQESAPASCVQIVDGHSWENNFLFFIYLQFKVLKYLLEEVLWFQG